MLETDGECDFFCIAKSYEKCTCGLTLCDNHMSYHQWLFTRSDNHQRMKLT